ncbi:MAG TPA: dTMP kinase [Nitrospiria bacterium]|jgi:dTMP kinase
MSGLFVTFEGIEGSGKSTQIQKLGYALNREGLSTVVTREPGGTPIGEKIREIILDKNYQKMASKTELFLYLSSRAQHIAELIQPSLEKGEIVISDRFSDATLAYQGNGRGRDTEQLNQLNSFILNGLEPDLTFLLDIDVSKGLSRIKKRGPLNRLDQENLEFHQRVREGYLQIAKENPKRIQVLSGGNDSETIHKEIMQILIPYLTDYRQSGKGLKKKT